ncbi:hypothetical protein GCM10023143_17990 [Compostibacter hankyongensis]|uniref:Calcineurin-like phosphoesterase domain-containing protein n=1 Tax=Compostibacter hankyongensis TaxID=1007089 RepID=A0ABP8FS83_9BACT
MLLAVVSAGRAQTTGTGQPGSYRQTEQSLQAAIEKNFFDAQTGFYREHMRPEKKDNKFSYLWPLCGLLQADNEIERLGAGSGLVDRTLGIIQQYYSPESPAPGFDSYVVKDGGGARFYDDNQWIGIAALDAYRRTGKINYLDVGKQVYRFMMTGFDTKAGGGLYWEEGNRKTKNTCSNGPGILVALQLYQATQDKKYLDTALLLYGWVNRSLQAPSGLYYDNLNLTTGKADRHLYAYNSGTMLQANVYLYTLTKEQQYLERAVRIADSSSAYFCADGKLRDGYWFSAVLLRAYQHLLQVYPDPQYVRRFAACVDDALQEDRHSSGLMGKPNPSDLVNQSGMLEILARLAFLEKQHYLGGLAGTPLFRFGVIADVQYADQDNAGTRHYRSSLRKLGEAVDTMNAAGVDFVLSLGDFIDKGFESFAPLNKITDRLKMPLYHVLGNHDFNIGEEQSKKIFGINTGGGQTKKMFRTLGLKHPYYAFEKGGWRFIELDAGDVSLFGNPEGSEKYRQASAILQKLKAEKAVNAENWNGALGSEQLRWLKEQLDLAVRKGERVILTCHMPLYPDKGRDVLWESSEVARLIEPYKNVMAYLNGHVHVSQYFLRGGVNYVSFKGMVEQEDQAFAIVSVYPDHLEIKGFGKEHSWVLRNAH